MWCSVVSLLVRTKTKTIFLFSVFAPLARRFCSGRREESGSETGPAVPIKRASSGLGTAGSDLVGEWPGAEAVRPQIFSVVFGFCVFRQKLASISFSPGDTSSPEHTIR